MKEREVKEWPFSSRQQVNEEALRTARIEYLYRRAQDDALTENEKKEWAALLKTFDYAEFSQEHSLHLFAIGRVTAFNEHFVAVEYLEGDKERFRSQYVKDAFAAAGIAKGDWFEMEIQHGARRRVKSVKNLVRISPPEEFDLSKIKAVTVASIPTAMGSTPISCSKRRIDDMKRLARKIAANAAEVASENQRLRLLITEMMNELCDRCAEESGGGSDRCPEYRADGELGRCVYSTQGYCTTRDLINRAMAEGDITK